MCESSLHFVSNVKAFKEGGEFGLFSWTVCFVKSQAVGIILVAIVLNVALNTEPVVHVHGDAAHPANNAPCWDVSPLNPLKSASQSTKGWDGVSCNLEHFLEVLSSF